MSRLTRAEARERRAEWRLLPRDTRREIRLANIKGEAVPERELRAVARWRARYVRREVLVFLVWCIVSVIYGTVSRLATGASYQQRVLVARILGYVLYFGVIGYAVFLYRRFRRAEAANSVEAVPPA
jgi:hypothetical protein